MAIKRRVPRSKQYLNTSGNFRGRSRGKNLTYSPDGYIYNQHGVEFTAADKKLLESRVNTANAKRRRMLKQEQNTQLFSAGKKVNGVMISDTIGRESDFVLAHKSKSLQGFKTYDDFENYINNLERVNRRDYISARAEQYQDGYVKAMEDNGFSDDMITRIKELTPEQFAEIAKQDEYVKFGYIYSPHDRQNVEKALEAGLKRAKLWR